MLRIFLALWLAITPVFAWAGSMTMMGVGAPPTSGPAFSLTFQSSNGLNSTASSVTYNAGSPMTYGAGNTRVVIGVSWANDNVHNITISSITVGSTSFTQVPGAYVSASVNTGGSDIWISNSPIAGSSGVVTVNFSNALGNATSVALYNLQTATPAAFAGSNFTVFNATSGSGSISVPPGGAGIAITSDQGFSGLGGSFTAGITQDFNIAYGAFSTPFFGGHTTSTGSVTVTATFSGAAGAPVSMASWGP